jgi:hypothetical protein
LTRTFLQVMPTLDAGGRLAGDGYGVSDAPGWRDVVWREHMGTIRLGTSDVAYVDVGGGGGRQREPARGERRRRHARAAPATFAS